MTEPSSSAERFDDAADSSILLRLGLTPVDAAIIVVACLVVVAYLPPLFFEGWTLRMAIILAAGPIGLALLVRLARNGDRAAGLLGAALIWTVFVSLFSGAPRSALLGFAGRDLSALTVVGSAGFWALGRMSTERGRTVLIGAVVWATGLNALVGLMQVVMDVQRGPLALLYDRPTGVVANPVYFGALCAAGLCTAVAAWSASTWKWMLAPMIVLGVGTSLSGSRVAFLAAIVVIVAQVATHRSRERVVAAAISAASILSGVSTDRTVGAGRNAADRFAATSGSGSGRTTVWKYGLEAWTDRPIVGHGFGRFRPAVQGKFSPSFVRDFASDERLQPWFDPHNAVVAVLVAVGVVGAVLFGAWVIVWGWGMRGPLAWAVIALALHWMLQPMSLFTLPLAMLLFGAAARPAPPNEAASAVSVPVLSSNVRAGTLAVGALMGAYVLAADVMFERAADPVDARGMASVAPMFWDDPVVADVVAQAYALDASVDDVEAKRIEWRARAADAEPDRPYWWWRLAEEQVIVGRLAEADVSIARAFDLQPNNAGASRVEAFLALESGDEARLAASLVVACELGQLCDLDAAALIANADDANADDADADDG